MDAEPAPQFRRPERERRPRAGEGADTGVLVAAIVVLLFVVAVLVWRRRYRALPRCDLYSGAPGGACTELRRACGGDRPCLNAVAHCMPLVERAEDGDPLAVLDAPELGPCARSLARVDPHFVANAAVRYGGAKACVPQLFADLLDDPRGCHAAARTFQALAPLIPYSVEVARALPACPAGRG